MSAQIISALRIRAEALDYEASGGTALRVAGASGEPLPRPPAVVLAALAAEFRALANTAEGYPPDAT